MQFEKMVLLGDRALWAFGLLKLALLAAFFASFAVVADADAQASGDRCDGINLLEKLKKDDPASHERILEQAASTINSDGVFWKVEKDGQAPSWLFGTMHLADPEISTLPEDVKTAIRATDSVVIETTDILDRQAAQRAMAKLAHLTFLTKGTLRDVVPDELEGDLEQMVAARGLPFQLAERMRPWVIATTIALPICEFKRKQSGARVLDEEIAHFGQQSGKNVEGLETLEEQLTAMATIPENYHIANLEETLASKDILPDVIATMVDLYQESRIGTVFPLMRNVMPNSAKGDGAAEFQGILIDRRNKVMLERSLPILEKGSAFIAVGALHLPGETGLVKLLRDQGYAVTRVR